MKKWISFLLLLCLLLSFTACNSQTEKMPVFTETAEAPAPSGETAPSPEEPQDSSQKILIAYFSWADNTVVTDEEASIESVLRHYESVGDSSEYTDAVSSASVVQPGNVAAMAGWIQNRLGGDLFPILVREPYPKHL